MKTQLWWAIHNIIAHPLSEILYWTGLKTWADWIHDNTIPDHEPGSGRG